MNYLQIFNFLNIYNTETSNKKKLSPTFSINNYIIQRLIRQKNKNPMLTYTIALTPLQYRSHMLRNRGCPPMSQIFNQNKAILNKHI